MALLNDHFRRIQKILTEEGCAASSFSHAVNKGLIREAFVRRFLSKNMPANWGIGTGEIIHQDAVTKEDRPQIDAVIHDKNHPKLTLSGEIDLFFIETVSTIIEIKSKVDKQDLISAGKTAALMKNYASEANRRDSDSYLRYGQLPYPYAFLIAYDGPKKLSTMRNWFEDLSGTRGPDGLYDLRNTAPTQLRQNWDFIDGVFVLGKGFVVVDALGRGPQSRKFLDRESAGSELPLAFFGDDQELFLLWVLIHEAIALRTNTIDIFDNYIESLAISFDAKNI